MGSNHSSTMKSSQYSVSPKHNHTILFQSSPGRARGSRHSASVCIRVHPWPNRLFSLAFGQLSKFGFWATDGHGYTRIECVGFTETIYQFVSSRAKKLSLVSRQGERS